MCVRDSMPALKTASLATAILTCDVTPYTTNEMYADICICVFVSMCVREYI